MKGILHFTGEHGAGKTYAVLGLNRLDQTAFFHDDIKVPYYNDILGEKPDKFQFPLSSLGFCANLIDGGVWGKGKPVKGIAQSRITFSMLRELILPMIELVPKNIKCIIFDTFTRLESSIYMYGKSNSGLTRDKSMMISAQMGKGEKKGAAHYAQQWGEGRYQIGEILNILNERFESVVLVTHLKNHYQSGEETGREIPDSTKVLDKACNARFWLRSNPESGVPVILALKRPAITKVVEGKLKVVNTFPRKITPQPNEESIWDCFDRYLNDPIGNRSPRDDEQPSAFEMSILDGILTEDQKEIWRANLEAPFDQFARQDTIDERIRVLGGERYNTFEIIDMIKEEFEGEVITTEMVTKLL